MDFRTLIVASDLAERLDRPGLVLLDCRFDLMQPAEGHKAWLESHIPGARHADLDRDLTGVITPETGRHPLPHAEEMAKRFGAMGIGNNVQVIVYDESNGGIAARAWWLLRWLGHERVALLDGGYSRWVSLNLPVRSGAEPVTAAQFEANVRHEWVVGLEALLERPGAIEDLRLVDARDAARFRGEHEPIDPVAGHIPGARNLFFEDTLAADGTMLPEATVRDRLLRVLDGDLERDWSVMCGSGVTACQLALAAEHAGVRAPRLYAGSFSEWIRDPARPVGREQPGPDSGCADRTAT